jgi:hypothetical protein
MYGLCLNNTRKTVSYNMGSIPRIWYKCSKIKKRLWEVKDNNTWTIKYISIIQQGGYKQQQEAIGKE